ncbi:MAG: recombinase family protein [Erysipelotrichaceae bacterium]
MARIRKSETSSKTTSIIWYIALYIRLSREDGNDVSVSVDNQLKELNTFMENFDGMFEIVDTYIDDGYTGTDSNRENLQRMLSDVRAKKVNCVIVRDPSRLSRNYLEAGMYMEQLFVQLNVRFISLSLPALDSHKNPDAMNSIAVPIQNVINDDFCRQTSQKIRGVFNMKRSRGEFIGAFAPYGYAKSPEDKNCLVIDDEASENVRSIFRWFADEGMSKHAITKKLNALGILNPTSYKQSQGLKYHCRVTNNDGMWSNRTVSMILSNEMYIGNMVQGRQRLKSYKVHDAICVPKEEWYIVENTHEAIIDKETFNKAQGLQKRDTRVSPKTSKITLFAGFLKCADCGQAMMRTNAKGKNYYVCRTNRDKSSTACSTHSIREDVLREAVLIAIQKQIDLVENINQIIEEMNKLPDFNTKSDRLEKALRTKQMDLAKSNTVLDSLYMDWKTDDITQEMYRRMKTKLETDVERASNSIKKIQEEIGFLEKGVKNDNPLFKTFLKFKNVKELDRNLLVCLIDKIYVHEDKHITIKFNFADTYMRVI